MSKSGRIVTIPHPKAEVDLDQLVLAVLGDLDPPAKPGKPKAAPKRRAS